MQINIEVNEAQFQTIMEKTLIDLPKEKIEEIVIEGLKQYLSTSDVLENLLTKRRSSYDREIVPSDFLLTLVSKMTATDGINDIRDGILNRLHENYDQILREAIADVLIQGFVYYGNESLRNTITMVIREEAYKKEN